MTLEDLVPNLPLSYAQGSGYGLVFLPEIKQELDAIQSQHPPKNYASPVATTDGRFVLHGDLLSEVGPNGMYEGVFQYLDESKYVEITVISWADAVALLPVGDVE